MFSVLRRTYGAPVAATAVVITATAGLVFFLFATVIVDLQLTLFVVAAVFAHLSFARAPEDGTRTWRSLLVFALLAGGFLTKGPVAIVLFVLPVGIWTAVHRKWAALRAHSWIAGIALFSAIVAPWFILAEIRNPGFLRYFFINENLLRFLSARYGDRYGTGHVLPRGSAIPIFLLGTLPWAPVAIWLVVKRRWQVIRSTLRDESSSLFFIGFLSIVLFWGLARQLLPTYVLPAIPLFAAWLALELRHTTFPVDKLPIVTAGTIAAWCLVIVAVFPAVVSRSTHDVLSETERVLGPKVDTTTIVFAGRAPHSAFFYAPGLITQHSPESLHDSLTRVLDAKGESLLVIRDGEWAKFPQDHLRQVHLLLAVPGWKVLEAASGNLTAHLGPVDSDDSPRRPARLGSSTFLESTVSINRQPW
jgi:4-amino-4-deoxy-L-arabinose transferase-like glycosyltransferase